MDEVQVKVVGLKLLHALQAVLANLGMIGVPQLGGQPEVLTADLSLLVQILQSLTKTGLVLVCLSAVNVPTCVVCKRYARDAGCLL